MFKKILIPTDGSVLAMKAARAGLALAKALGAKIVACCVVEDLQPVFGPRSAVSREMIDEYNARARELGQKHVDAVGKLATRLGVPFASSVTQERPVPEGIVEVAGKYRCDVIFMATHGRSGLSKIVLGSVTQKVLMLSALPVVIYR
jgi:nucleotide-binding universal stress UspA family protein